MAKDEVSSSSNVRLPFWRIKRPCPVCIKEITNSNIHRHVRDIHQVDLHDYQPSLIKKKEKKLDEGNENCKINKSQHLNVASFTSKPQLDIVGNQSNKLHVSVEVAQFKPQAFLKCNQNVSIPISNTNRKTPFKCEKCHLSFRLKSELKLHTLSTHEKSPVFECKGCTKVFISKVGLIDHQKIHTDEKPFYCHYCPKRFRTRGLWRNHQMDHTGERPFKCTYCLKGFKLKFQLQMHLTKCEKREIGNEKHTNHTKVQRKDSRQGLSIRVKQEISYNSLKELKDKERSATRSRACDTENSDEEHLAKWRLKGLVPFSKCCIVVKRHSLIEEAVEKGWRSIKVDQN